MTLLFLWLGLDVRKVIREVRMETLRSSEGEENAGAIRRDAFAATCSGQALRPFDSPVARSG